MSGSEGFSGSAAPMHHPAGARASHGPTGPLDGTLAPTADPELAELHAAVDQLAAAVAEHAAAIDAVQARIQALDGDGR